MRHDLFAHNYSAISWHGCRGCSAPMTWLNSKLHRKLRLNQDRCSGSSRIATSRLVCNVECSDQWVLQ